MLRLHWRFRLRTLLILVAMLAVLFGVSMAVIDDKQHWNYYCTEAAYHERYEHEAFSEASQADVYAADSLDQAALCDRFAKDARQGKKEAAHMSPHEMADKAAWYRAESKRLKREAIAKREKAEGHARLKWYYEWRCWLWRPAQEPVALSPNCEGIIPIFS